MPVEQGLPWHPVATGLAGQAIPFIVAASHAQALPSAPFWFPVPAILVASPALLCPSSLFAVLALVPPGVAPAFCVSVLLLPLSGGAAGCPCRAPPPVPPACPPVRGFHISVRCGLSRVRLAGHGPVATPVAGTSRRAGQFPPLWSIWAPCRGRGGGVCCALSPPPPEKKKPASSISASQIAKRKPESCRLCNVSPFVHFLTGPWTVIRPSAECVGSSLSARPCAWRPVVGLLGRWWVPWGSFLCKCGPDTGCPSLAR